MKTCRVWSKGLPRARCRLHAACRVPRVAHCVMQAACRLLRFHVLQLWTTCFILLPVSCFLLLVPSLCYTQHGTTRTIICRYVWALNATAKWAYVLPFVNEVPDVPRDTCSLLPSVACCALRAAGCMPLAVLPRAAIVDDMLHTAPCFLLPASCMYAACCMLFAVSCVLPAACRLPLAACRLPPAQNPLQCK